MYYQLKIKFFLNPKYFCNATSLLSPWLFLYTLQSLCENYIAFVVPFKICISITVYIAYMLTKYIELV